jgi:phosphoglycerol transferase MdoB-like AlkP superfamily enzyme
MLPEFLISSSYNLPVFFSKLWFIYPFLGLIFFQGKVRIFWMISVIILSFILFQNQLVIKGAIIICAVWADIIGRRALQQ